MLLTTSFQIDPFGCATSHPLGWGIKRCSELALSKAKGVNPEQASVFRLGSRKVDVFSGFLPEKACPIRTDS